MSSRYLKKMKNLVEISTLVTEATDFYSVKDKIVSKMLEVVHPTRACVNLFYNNDFTHAYLVCSETLNHIPTLFESDGKNEGLKIRFDSYPKYIQEAVHNKKIIYIPDVMTDPRADSETEMAQLEGYLGRIVFPIIIKSRVVGFLTCFLLEGDYIDENDIDFIKQVVSLMGLSIEITKKNKKNAQIITKLRNILKSVNDVNLKLLDGKDINSYLEDACRLACTVTNSLEAAILIYDKKDKHEYETKYFSFYDHLGNYIDVNSVIDKIFLERENEGYKNNIDPVEIFGKNNGVNSYSFVKQEYEEQLVFIVCVNAESYNTDDVTNIGFFINQVFLGIKLFESTEKSISHEVLQKELSIIGDQQKLIMNRSNAVLKGDRELFYYHKPSKIIGGDAYIAETGDNGLVKFMIADVMGHGIVSNYIVALMKGAFKVLAKQTKNPSNILQSMNNMLYEEFDKMGVFATCMIGTLNTNTNTLLMANAGHYFPIIIKDKNTVINFSKGNRGVPIGIVEDAEYENNVVNLLDYPMITFFTDGILELKDENKNEYGKENFTKFLIKNYENTQNEIIENFIKDIEKFSRKSNFDDDILFVSIKKRI